jgi:trk system potassium uptake protein
MQKTQTKSKSQLISLLNIIEIIAIVLAVISLIVSSKGLYLNTSAKVKLGILDWAIVAIFIIEYYTRWGIERFRLTFLKNTWANLAIIFLFLVFFLIIFRYTSVSQHSRIIDEIVMAKLFIFSTIIIRAVSVWQKVTKSDFSPALTVLLSFLFVITAGTGFLLLPGATQSPDGISVIDALFTATSATCVTGLIVVDTGSYFTRFGQIIILSLIQIGGLGLVTIAAFFSIILSSELSIKENLFMSNMLGFKTMSKISTLIISILT